MKKVLDLNIFYKEFYTKELGTWWDDKLTIEAYVRTYDGAVYNTETGVVLRCDEYETNYLQKQFPADEYGDDFWVFADEVDMPSRRIAKILQGIDLNAPRENAARLTYTGPVTMT